MYPLLLLMQLSDYLSKFLLLEIHTEGIGQGMRRLQKAAGAVTEAEKVQQVHALLERITG